MKIIIGVGAVLLVVGGTYYFFALRSQSLVLDTFPTNYFKFVVVTYTDEGFSPSNVSVAQGDTVRFMNQSSEDLWVGANPHPVHSEYPTEGGCIASTFDSCRGIPPGDTWEFTFDIAGTWGYHDHLNPGKQGKIVVR